MKLIDNAFIRAVILFALCGVFFGVAKWAGAKDIGASLVSVATVISGVAAGALKDAERQGVTPTGVTPTSVNPTSPADPAGKQT